MKTVPALILASLLLCACASTQPLKVTPQALPRAKPSECMATCQVNQCLVPDIFASAPLRDQIQMLVECDITNAGDARECARRQKCLSDWIDAAP